MFIFRCGDRMVGSGLDQTGWISLIFLKKSGRIRVRSDQFTCIFFQIFDRFRLDWRSFDLGSGRIISCQLDFFLNQVGSGSSPNESDKFFRSDRILPPLIVINIKLWFWIIKTSPRDRKKKSLQNLPAYTHFFLFTLAKVSVLFFFWLMS
jgi:hypothetical protein